MYKPAIPGVKVKVNVSTTNAGDSVSEFDTGVATASPTYRRSPASSSPSTNRTVK